jgi:hypothetical protein
MLRSALILLALALVAPASASAVTKYRVSVSGTYTATGTVTNSGCYVNDATQTLSGEARETVRFRTTRSSIIFVQRRSDFPAVALNDDHRPVKAKATVERSSTLDDRESPRGCNGTPDKQDCGTKTLAFDIGFGGARNGVVPDLSKNGFEREALFSACAVTVGMPGFPTFIDGAGVARVSASRLLSGRRLVLRGGKKGSERLEGSDVSGGGQFDLRYKLTLTPVR